MKPKCLVITPIEHIAGVEDILKSFYELTIFEDPTIDEVIRVIKDYDTIFTNPNKSKIFLGPQVLDYASKLKVIATASTGTNHIDKDYAKQKGIQVLSLTEERHIIETISSTAEHAFALTLSSLRKVVNSHNEALLGEWDYTRYIGRQMDYLTIGVIGYGRLGSLYTRYCKAFGSEIIVFDPYKAIRDNDVNQVDNLEALIKVSDVISLHVHVNEETTGMINKSLFDKMKNDVLIVNTSRGEIINETDLVEFLSNNENALFATDVLTNEIKNRENSPLFKFVKEVTNQVTLTQHIGGMTKEAQQIAYCHAAKLLNQYFLKKLS
jgi:phosphoglycerate dehydrogenase-like enzyme